jgi:6-pyruvoyltetrahydropterin/6-carboxytetrahydropterin synthase
VIQISKEVSFDAGHRVPGHDGPCRNPHGHHYTVVVEVSADEVIQTPGDPQEGMVLDFAFLKEALVMHVHRIFDHGFIVYARDSVMLDALNNGVESWKVIRLPYVPTAENIARWVYEQLELLVANCGASLTRVDVWETPTSIASYKP